MSDQEEGVKTVNGAFRELIETYNDLNPNVVDEVWEEPSALEFMQYVANNRPLVIRQGAQSFKAVQKWSAKYLIDVVGENHVNVSITPHGNADSILENEDKSLLFVKPYEREERFQDLIRYIQSQEKDPSKHGDPVKYGQTQNDNLRNEYSSLFDDIPSKGPPFARIALSNSSPDAINFWLGNSLSTTSLHKDNYENIYVQVRGKKHFVLLPPVAAAAVNERSVVSAEYVLREQGDCEKGEESGENGEAEERKEIVAGDLIVQLDTETSEDEDESDSVDGGEGSDLSNDETASPEEGEEIEGEEIEVENEDHPSSPKTVRWALWDPDNPEERKTPYSSLIKPLRVTLNEGDMLYLPALWYHKVAQSCGEEGFCCAVNYWYDMDFSGAFWATNAFIRDIVRAEVER